MLDVSSVRTDRVTDFEPRHTSRSVRLYFSGKNRSKSLLDFVHDRLLPDMIEQAKENYVIGFRPDCVVMTEKLLDDASLRVYCRNNELRIGAEIRDAPAHELVCHLLAQALPHLARTMSPHVTVTAEASFVGIASTPLIRLSLA